MPFCLPIKSNALYFIDVIKIAAALNARILPTRRFRSHAMQGLIPFCLREKTFQSLHYFSL